MQSPRLIGGPTRDTPRPSRWPSALAVLATAAIGGLFGMWLANRSASTEAPRAAPASRATASQPNVLADLDAVLERRTSQDTPESKPAAAIGVPPVVDSPAVLGFSVAGQATREAVRRAANWRPPGSGAIRDVVRPAAPPVRFAYAAARGVPMLMRPPPTPMPQSEATMVRLPSAASAPAWLANVPDAAPVVPTPHVPAVEATAVPEPSPKTAAKPDTDIVFPQVAPLKPKPLPIQVAAARAPATPAPTATPVPTPPPTPVPSHATVLPALPGTAGAIVSVTPPPPVQPTPHPGPAPVAPQSAPPVPAAAPPAPVAAAAPIVVPIAPPVAPPPVPFAYIGHFSEQGGDVVAFVAAGDRLYSVKPGDLVEEDYRIDHVEPNRLSFTYLPMKLKQSLALSPSSSHGAAPPPGKE